MELGHDADSARAVPALAFDRLFRDEIRPSDSSVLDAVLAEAAGLRNRISLSDKQRLEEYLESVREVERRIENAGKARWLQGWRPTLDKPDIARPADAFRRTLTSTCG